MEKPGLITSQFAAGKIICFLIKLLNLTSNRNSLELAIGNENHVGRWGVQFSTFYDSKNLQNSSGNNIIMDCVNDGRAIF
jgi:hypothetical protein